MTKIVSAVTASAVGALLIALASSAVVRSAFTGEPPPGVVVVSDADLKWVDAVGMPAGTKLAVLAGDPAQVGPFTIRLKLPRGWKAPPHTHPTDEHVTILDGKTAVGFGDKFDEAAMKEVNALGFVRIPAGTRHFAQSKDGATIQVHGTGPWGVEYVNAADDPRHGK